MLKRLVIIALLMIPLSIMAQDDDPFGNPGGGGSDDPFGSPGGGNNDPFGDTSSPPTSQPTNPTVNEPYNPNPVNNNTDPFYGGDVSNSGSVDDPFGSGDGGGGDFSDFGGGNLGGGSSSYFDNMVDTLTDPLVPEFPWKQIAIKQSFELADYNYEESDIFWAKTIWREIDLREKMNHPFAYPRAPFMTILLDVLQKHPEIPVYQEDIFTGRDFSDITSWDSIKTSLGNKRTETVYDEDANGNIIEFDQEIIDKFRVGKVKRFAIKEVWFFDKKHSTMKVEIMGIAPMIEISAVDQGADAVLLQQMGMTNMTTTQTLFWVYFPDVRKYLAHYQTFNPLNDAIRMSWDDLFTSRFFASYITKASNPLDQRIKDYEDNSLDALYEGERIKEEIFNFEHDLWSY